MNLIHYDNACREIALATTVDEAKDWADKSAALRAYARQAHNTELEIQCAEIRLRALRRMGELSKALEKAEAKFRGNQHEVTSHHWEVTSKADTLREAGISTSSAHRSELLAGVPEAEFEHELATARDEGKPASAKKLLSKVRREARIEALAEPEPLDDIGRYSVLYADPPWRYEHVETENRAIENQYPTMSLEDICALPVSEICTDAAVLFLWATSPKLFEAMRVIEAWGFTYRTCAVWVKDKIGMGYYYRQRHELLLVATLGQIPVPLPANRPDSVIEAPRGQHSAKPVLAAEQIERMYPELRKVELFCRSPREGWRAWGNQA